MTINLEYIMDDKHREWKLKIQRDFRLLFSICATKIYNVDSKNELKRKNSR